MNNKDHLVGQLTSPTWTDTQSLLVPPPSCKRPTEHHCRPFQSLHTQLLLYGNKLVRGALFYRNTQIRGALFNMNTKNSTANHPNPCKFNSSCIRGELDMFWIFQIQICDKSSARFVQDSPLVRDFGHLFGSSSWALVKPGKKPPITIMIEGYIIMCLLLEFESYWVNYNCQVKTKQCSSCHCPHPCSAIFIMHKFSYKNLNSHSQPHVKERLLKGI